MERTHLSLAESAQVSDLEDELPSLYRAGARWGYLTALLREIYSFLGYWEPWEEEDAYLDQEHIIYSLFKKVMMCASSSSIALSLSASYFEQVGAFLPSNAEKRFCSR